MSCTLDLLESFIGLATDRIPGQGYFIHCIGTFLGAKKVKIIYTIWSITLDFKESLDVNQYFHVVDVCASLNHIKSSCFSCVVWLFDCRFHTSTRKRTTISMTVEARIIKMIRDSQDEPSKSVRRIRKLILRSLWSFRVLKTLFFFIFIFWNLWVHAMEIYDVWILLGNCYKSKDCVESSHHLQSLLLATWVLFFQFCVLRNQVGLVITALHWLLLTYHMQPSSIWPWSR